MIKFPRIYLGTEQIMVSFVNDSMNNSEKPITPDPEEKINTGTDADGSSERPDSFTNLNSDDAETFSEDADELPEAEKQRIQDK